MTMATADGGTPPTIVLALRLLRPFCAVVWCGAVTHALPLLVSRNVRNTRFVSSTRAHASYRRAQEADAEVFASAASSRLLLPLSSTPRPPRIPTPFPSPVATETFFLAENG